ncbi:Glucose-1-phosphate adenylyltransferase [Ferriphaselus amnicola]|uniref:Glucose-1-phosphate adenylyltransferase n=1 Tax=Ferriphaselus amnicola TaxID=1188319 RepID=A0A2Z6GF99_9PROT|nr:glucose-1-phosphate adenylyltransferase [Ferriphaselus amnicola]BBE51914.1 Glucose-1-phosphate adenylyltransferase [Ferriphaselus amnicola]
MSQPQEKSQEKSRYVSLMTKNTYAMVLAGGRGSRLHQLTDWRAKPAVPFGGKFRIVDFVLSNCVNSGIRRIGVATQYKSHSLIRHIQRGWSFLNGKFGEFIDILPAQQRIDEEWYQGTADAVFQNIDILREINPEYVLILAGDHVYKMDYGKMLAFHADNQADMTVACIQVPIEEAKAFGVMGVDANSRVVNFTEKPDNPSPMPGKSDTALCSMGIYIFNTRFLYEQLMRDADDSHSSHDFGKDIIPHLVKSNYRVFAQSFDDSCVKPEGGVPYWRDVGTIDSYWEANMELTKIVPDLNMYDQEWPIWTYQEQLPPAKFIFNEGERRGQALDSLVSGGCIISGATVVNSLLFSDVVVHSYATVEESVILPNVSIGRNAVLKRVVVDKGCIIPDGLVVGVNHEDDAKRFFVTSRGITLITPDMLGQQDIHRVR